MFMVVYTRLDTIRKCKVFDNHHTARNCYWSQTTTVFERWFSNGFHVAGDVDAGQATATRERIITDTRYQITKYILLYLCTKDTYKAIFGTCVGYNRITVKSYGD